jgi:hypothetical protein
MPNIPVKPKPIAILACKYSQGIDWAREVLDIREINGARKRITDTTGQEYYVCTNVDDIRGFIFSDVRIAAGFGEHPDYDAFLAEARARIY